LPDETVYHNAAMSHGSMPAAENLSRTVTVIIAALASTRALHAEVLLPALGASAQITRFWGM
jgi:hypothetical protein